MEAVLVLVQSSHLLLGAAIVVRGLHHGVFDAWDRGYTKTCLLRDASFWIRSVGCTAKPGRREFHEERKILERSRVCR